MKKQFIRFCQASLTCLALLYGFVLLRSVIPTTVHDEELRLDRASIPKGSNAFDVLQQAGSHLAFPDKQTHLISDLSNDTNWDASAAQTILDNNREALAEWDAAANLPDFQVPEVSIITGELPPYLAKWKKLASVMGVRETFLLHNGKDQEAFDQIMNQIQLGRRMQNAHGTVLCYLVGLAVNTMALNRIQHWAGKVHLDSGQLKAYIRQLALDPDVEGTAFANSLKAEYQCDIQTLDALRSGKIMNPDTGAFYPRPTLLSASFNVTQTKALFASTALLLVKAAPHHYNKAKLPDLNSTRPGLVSMIMSGNIAGQIMYNLLMPALYPLAVKKSQGDAQLQATRIILALRAYQLTHGNLPSTLSALVPEFLDRVPMDDFDGQPLRYSADRKIVYSVGKNLKDDGGDDRRPTSTSQPPDLVYHFDF